MADLDSPADRAALGEVLRSARTRKQGHDLKQLFKALRRRGMDFRGGWFDTMLAGYCLNPSRTRYAIEDLALEHLGRRLPPPGPDRLCVEAATVEDLARRLEEDLERLSLKPLFDRLEMPLVEILADMELVGIQVDRGYLYRLQEELAGRIAALQAELHALAGAAVNLNSPKQIASVLFQKLGLPAQRRTKTGFSTDEEVLRTLSAAHPFPRKLLEYRELSKLRSTYVDALLEQADADGRVHTEFLQTGTATGRLSSVGPNLQNIPVRTPEGQKVRRAFGVPPESVLLSADYSQIDLRVLAHLSGDRALREAFARREDIHARTAAEVFHVPPDRVDPEARRLAKAINFGIVYGQTPRGLALEMGISPGQAQDYIARYMARYAGVAQWIQRQLQRARLEGSVRTLMGRIRYLPELSAKSATVRAFAERVAVNTPIQGSSADIIKAAMIAIWNLLRAGGYRTRMLLQIHDELLFEVPRAELEAVAPRIQRAMETAVALEVPIEVGLKVGPNWQEMESLELKV